VEGAKEGHEQAFFGLFELHRRRVYSLCLRLIGSVPEAEELTRDIFMEAFRKLNAMGDDAAFSKWLYHNAVNAVLMRLQQRNARESFCASHRDEEVWSSSWEVSRLWEQLEGQGGSYGDSGGDLGCTTKCLGDSCFARLPESPACLAVFPLHPLRCWVSQFSSAQLCSCSAMG